MVQLGTPLWFVVVGIVLFFGDGITSVFAGTWVDAPKFHVKHNANGAYRSWSEKYKLPEPGRGKIRLHARMPNDLIIGFSSAKLISNPMYELVIGTRGNTCTSLRKEHSGGEVDVQNGHMHQFGTTRLVITLDRITKMIKVLKIMRDGRRVILFERIDQEFLDDVQYIAFSGYNNEGFLKKIQISALPERGKVQPEDPEDNDDFVGWELDSEDDDEEDDDQDDWGDDNKVDNSKTYLPDYRIPPNKWGTYKKWKNTYELPEEGEGVLYLRARMVNDVFIGFSSRKQTHNPMYEIVVGGGGNTTLFYRRNAGGPNDYYGPAKLDAYRYTRLRVVIDKQKKKIKVEKLLKNKEKEVLFETRDENFLDTVKYVNFTGWNNGGRLSHIHIERLRG